LRAERRQHVAETARPLHVVGGVERLVELDQEVRREHAVHVLGGGGLAAVIAAASSGLRRVPVGRPPAKSISPPSSKSPLPSSGSSALGNSEIGGTLSPGGGADARFANIGGGVVPRAE
jgi:hypothetical protein